MIVSDCKCAIGNCVCEAFAFVSVKKVRASYKYYSCLRCKKHTDNAIVAFGEDMVEIKLLDQYVEDMNKIGS